MKRIGRILAFTFLAAALVSFQALGIQIDDKKFGFSLIVPDSYSQLQIEPGDLDTIYKFSDREGTPADPANVILLQRMGETIRLDSRISPSDLPKIEGVEFSLEETAWNNTKVSIVRQVISLPNGGKYVTLTFQIPLSGEAVQLQAGSSIDREPVVRALFQGMVNTLKNTRSLHQTTANSTFKLKPLSDQERVQKLISGVAKVSIAAFIILMIARTIFKKR